MTLADDVAARRAQDAADAELAELYNTTGIDLTPLPPIMTAEQLAIALGVTVGSLTQDRYRNRGCPYLRMGRRIRYARADVARYLAANWRSTSWCCAAVRNQSI
jgi:hypothetical protein